MTAMLAPDEEAIARSVLFASLFDYPLTLAQLRQTLIASRQTPSHIIATYGGSAALRSIVEWRDGFFFPRSRPDLPDVRRRREHFSRAFLDRHHGFLRLACAMPFVRMVALSGSVAHLNMEEDGDLDLFVVTRGRHAWTVTVALVLLAKLMRRRQILCANFVTADSCLDFEPDDLFTASQILHLRPLIGHDVQRALLAANPSVRRYYPNAHLPLARPRTSRLGSRVKRLLEYVLALPAAPAEWCCRTAYRRYLLARSRHWSSPEQVRLDRDRLKLHTNSHRRSVLERFDRIVLEAIDAALVATPREPAAGTRGPQYGRSIA
jgi:hypothetical protein